MVRFGEFVTLAGSKFLAMVLTMAATAAAGRVLGPATFGRWMLIVAAGSLLHTAFVNWTHASTVRYGREEWIVSGGLSRTLGARLPLIAAGLAIAVTIVIFPPVQWLQRWFSIERADLWLLALVTLSTWMAAEAQATLQAADRVDWQAATTPIVAAGSLALLLALVYWFERRSLAAAALALTLPALIGWGAVWAVTIGRSSTRVSRLSMTDLGRHLRYAAPLVPALILGYASDWGDHLLLKQFSSVAQVGLFALLYQFLAAAMAANGVVGTLILPRLVAREHASPGSMRDYLSAEVPTIYPLWMLVSIWLVAALPVAVAAVLGPTYDESMPVLLVLLVAIPSSVLTSLYTVLFNLQERMGAVLGYLFALTLTNLLLSVLLIPPFGAMGAATGTAASYLVGQALYVSDQHRRLQVSPRAVAILSIVGLAIGLTQLAVGGHAGARMIWAVLASLLLGFVIRQSRCIDARVLADLCAGRPQRVGVLIAALLVPRAGVPSQVQ